LNSNNSPKILSKGIQALDLIAKAYLNHIQ